MLHTPGFISPIKLYEIDTVIMPFLHVKTLLEHIQDNPC
jgi:hypothetical protein